MKIWFPLVQICTALTVLHSIDGINFKERGIISLESARGPRFIEPVKVDPDLLTTTAEIYYIQIKTDNLIIAKQIPMVLFHH